MIDLYRQAWGALRSFGLAILVFAVLTEVMINLFGDNDTYFAVWSILILQFAYFVHRYFLFGEELSWSVGGTDKPPERMGAFYVSAGLVLLLSVSVGIGVWSGLDLSLRNNPWHYAAFLGCQLGCALLLLSLSGTSLPAAIVGDDPEPDPRSGPGLRMFWPVFFGLLYGPGLTGAVLFGILVAAGLPIAAGRAGAGLVLEVAATMASLVMTLMAVAVLCRAYRNLTADGPAEAPADRD